MSLPSARSMVYKIFPLILVLLCAGCMSVFYIQIEITPSQAQKVLEFAISQEGKPYVLGGQDPNVGFDCSGLIVWAYKKVIPEAKFLYECKLVDDVDVEHLYKENTRLLELDEVIAGDIVFIANQDNVIEHCGLVIKVYEKVIKIIHASGSLGKVVIEQWGLNEEVREGHIQGFGRLKIYIRRQNGQ